MTYFQTKKSVKEHADFMRRQGVPHSVIGSFVARKHAEIAERYKREREREFSTVVPRGLVSVLDDLMSRVCRMYGVKAVHVRSRSRKHELMPARYVFITAALKLDAPPSTVELAVYMRRKGGHSVVIWWRNHASAHEKRIGEQFAKEANFRERQRRAKAHERREKAIV